MGSTDHVIPERLGRYRIVRELGAGAMGTVYEAVDELLGRRVAVKTVRVKPTTRESTSKRFLNEAKAVAAVSHPNIVPIYDLGFEGTTPFIVMELVRGPTLKTRIEEGACTPEMVGSVGLQLAQALETAHAAGIVHRDVKPANVLEASPGHWKLADFGVAHVPDSSLTMTGQFVGSVAYAPPEALVLGQLGPPADVYGLGATLYEMACGKRPYEDAPQGNLGDMLVRPPPPALHAIVAGFPVALSNAIESTLQAEPGKRPSAGELARVLAATFPTLSHPSLRAASAPMFQATPPHGTPAPTTGAVIESPELTSSASLGVPTNATTVARRTRARGMVLALGGLGAAAIAGIVVLASRGGSDAKPVAADAAVAQVAVDAAPIIVAPDAAVVDEPPPPTETIAGLAPLREAVMAGRGSSAIRPLLALRKQHGKAAEIPYLLGIAYFTQRVDSEAIRMFQTAIALDPRYKTDAKLIKTALGYGLQTATYPWRVIAFLDKSVGDAAIPYLEEFAKDHPNARVRAHAKAALEKLR